MVLTVCYTGINPSEGNRRLSAYSSRCRRQHIRAELYPLVELGLPPNACPEVFQAGASLLKCLLDALLLARRLTLLLLSPCQQAMHCCQCRSADMWLERVHGATIITSACKHFHARWSCQVDGYCKAVARHMWETLKGLTCSISVMATPTSWLSPEFCISCTSHKIVKGPARNGNVLHPGCQACHEERAIVVSSGRDNAHLLLKVDWLSQIRAIICCIPQIQHL